MNNYCKETKENILGDLLKAKLIESWCTHRKTETGMRIENSKPAVTDYYFYNSYKIEYTFTKIHFTAEGRECYSNSIKLELGDNIIKLESDGEYSRHEFKTDKELAEVCKSLASETGIKEVGLFNLYHAYQAMKSVIE